MNKQGPNGIEWTDYTWNPVGGCRHGCRWKMPDGTIARCYAEAVAHGVARAAYPDGFQAHYWHPERLNEPSRLKKPARIFIDSMSDIMGHWVPQSQIVDVLSVCYNNPDHTFQLLTKNAPRLLQFKHLIGKNVWVGVSMPPSSMNEYDLDWNQKRLYIMRALSVLNPLQLAGITTWMSFEPLSFDVSRILDIWHDDLEMNIPIDWAVVGAASSGRVYYQPEPEWAINLLNALDDRLPVFMKGNLDWEPRREEFPETKDVQLELGL